MRALSIILFFLIAAPAVAAPRRVVSINLCTDQLAMLLLGPDRLVSVSSRALDPGISNMVAEARKYTVNDGTVEGAVVLKPDLILAMRLRQSERTRMLKNLGYRILTVPSADSVEDALRVIRSLAHALGAEERGDLLISKMRAGLKRVEAHAPKSRLSALVFQPRGGTIGSGTIVDDVLRHAGLSNVAAERGIVGAGTLDLEQIIAANPDVLIFDDDEQGGTSLAQSMLSHPALATLRAHARSVRIPTRMWWCPGPWLVDAMARLQKSVQGASPLDARTSSP